MYSKETNREGVTTFYRGKHIIGYRIDGQLYLSRKQILRLRGKSNGIAMTRSQGYRYWERYMPNRPEWKLPSIIRTAVNIEEEDEEMRAAFQYSNGDTEICTRRYMF